MKRSPFLVDQWSIRLVVALLTILLALLVAQTTFWHHMEARIYDYLVVQTAPRKADLPLTIIGIDEDTLKTLGACWPLAAHHHVRIMERLTEAGVSVVGFDVLLTETKSEADNLNFAGSLFALAPVVLAADMGFTEDTAVRQWYRIDPGKIFQDAGGVPGFAGMSPDVDATQRKVPQEEDSFWKAVVKIFDAKNPGVAQLQTATPDMLIRYLGGPHTITYIPYHHLLEPEKYLPEHWREFLNGNIVLIGRNMSVTQEAGYSQAEAYQTPFFAETKDFMPRVEIHANVIANMIEGNILRRAPVAWVFGLWAGMSLLAVGLMYHWRMIVSALVAFTLVGGALGGEWWLFMHENIWLPALGPSVTVLLIYLSLGLVAFLSEQRQRQQIRGAFSMYVAPAVVESMMADPDKLKLGGERKELTVLFTDLAGFTSIAEKLEPEVTATVLNEHLSAMTEAVLAHGGTLDKFIGDAVMAFWGAPLADELQAVRAMRAAVEMQARMAEQRQDILARYDIELRLRIGIHRGHCIVGNMGGANRFDYTVIGDTVNLASRLEGVNKAYGTEILVSDAVAAVIGTETSLREVDSVRVKGRLHPVAIYTPCDDARLLELSNVALMAYRNGRLAVARAGWESLLSEYPLDPIALLFLERIRAFGDDDAPPYWDGIHTLDSK